MGGKVLDLDIIRAHDAGLEEGREEGIKKSREEYDAQIALDRGEVSSGRLDVYFSKGSQLNIKITNQDDLNLYEAFCIMKEQR